MSEYIPFEIQEEILKRLPVKPLVQFRSVSKQWKGLIDSPDFNVSYGIRYPYTDRFILRYVPDEKNPTYVNKYITLVDNDDGHSLVQQDFVPTIPKTLEPQSMKVVGSSYGLMCLYNPDVKDMAVLWNHTIRKSVGIQLPCIYDTSNENLANILVHTVIGFGVCPATLDPTILKFERIYYKRKTIDMPVINSPWKVGVFTLSTGAWSILSTNLPHESIELVDKDQITINGFIYWLAFNWLGGLSNVKYLIVSFDLTTKEFKEINLPDSLKNRLCRIQTISKLRESLVVLAYHKELEEDISFSSCCLWMMKEQGGVDRSFTKLYNINMPSPKINKLLGFRKSGELIILRLQQDAEIQIYDPNSEDIHNLGIGKDGFAFFMCSYMETLLLLDQLDGFIYSISN